MNEVLVEVLFGTSFIALWMFIIFSRVQSVDD